MDYKIVFLIVFVVGAGAKDNYRVRLLPGSLIGRSRSVMLDSRKKI
jgi:hypothetical protein